MPARIPTSPRAAAPALELWAALALAILLVAAGAARAAQVPVAPDPGQSHPLLETGWVRSLDADLELRAAPREDGAISAAVPGARLAAEIETSIDRGEGLWLRLRYPGGERGWAPASGLRPVPAEVPLSAGAVRELDRIAIRSGARSGIVVRDGFGRELYAAGTTRPLILASVTKLFTVAAGLRYVPGTTNPGAILRPSDNYRAQLVMNRLGRARATRYAADLGARVRLADGSGLSPSNRASAGEVADLLLAIREQPYFEQLRRGLPLAGRSGTLEHRLVGTRAAGRVRAKTGTLFDTPTSALAGYVSPREVARGPNRVLTFVVLNNGIYPVTARTLQDRVALVLATRTVEE